MNVQPIQQIKKISPFFDPPPNPVKIKVMSSLYPENPIPINDWYKYIHSQISKR